jgi:HK97 family phage prohead protease
MTTATDRSFREKIKDVREQRRMARPLELRTDTASGQIVLEGYAATFGQYEVYGGPRSGGWTEQIHSRAFDKTLGMAPDVQLLVNHDPGYGPLARTKSGTLQLSVDHHGLLVRATLDPSDPDVQRLMPKMRRGDMDEMSFAFRVRDQEWDSSYTTRTITEVELQKGDVSVVNYGMNPNTAAMLSTEAVTALASLSNGDLLELRSMDRDQIKRAMAVLANAAGGTRAKAPKKYSDVSNFADPGYLDREGKPAKGGNGVKRYPLNSAARVRNAAARFAQNKGRYSSEQQSAIMGKIRSAAKKFGVEISDESKAMGGVDHYDVAPNAAGGTTLVAVLSDGQRVPLPSTTRGSAFTGAGYVWNPSQYPNDPHEEKFDKEELAMDTCDDADCDNPDHDHEQDDFGGKKAKPFGSDDDEGRATSTAPGGKLGGDDDDDDEDRADFPDSGAEMGDYAGTDAQGAIDDYDEDEDEHGVELGLVAALESTIVSCYKLAAEGEGNDELRALLARARRQISDIRGDRLTGDDDISVKLAELHAMTGDLPPETLTVTEGLRALAEAGFADTMQPKAS